MQKNVDEAVERLKAQGIEAMGMVCHVSNAQHRKNLIEKTVQVSESRKGCGINIMLYKRSVLHIRKSSRKF